jgi:hypothetical protein
MAIRTSNVICMTGTIPWRCDLEGGRNSAGVLSYYGTQQFS